MPQIAGAVTIRKGQCVGIFAGTGVGKSTRMGMITNHEKDNLDNPATPRFRPSNHPTAANLLIQLRNRAQRATGGWVLSGRHRLRARHHEQPGTEVIPMI